ncbi:preprotein translocase subunit SecA [Patescibacteria group bacterium]|nr:preprotein translocase subunit SecA [Patescibacteria group bacterium]
MSFIDKIIGDPGDRHIKKKLKPLVEKINDFESEYEKISDDQLRAKTQKFRDELKNKKTLDDILPDAFAVVREASKRALGMRHFDVQLIGAMVLNQGDIAEMRTGEGKTLVATLTIYLNALEGKGAHVVTVNDYLARRDAVWMAQIYDFLGLSVGCIQHEKSYIYDSHVIASESTDERGNLNDATNTDDKNNNTQHDDKIAAVADTLPRNDTISPMIEIDYDHLRPVERRQAYEADVTYGTNNEFGFDYLRDNMVADKDQMVQRPFNFAIVDEVDSILIDEARTPLIISAPDNRPIDLYYKYAQLVKKLKENEDYNIDEKMRSSTLSEDGIKKMEQWLEVKNIYTEAGLDAVHHIEQALKANTLFEKDKDYIVQENEIIIVDEFTGRLMHGRRYSEGLHQAIEAKEGVEIKRESRTLATITFQNYFRLYPKLAGMTGTAKTEEEEFRRIYGLDVYVVPTNKPIARIDHSDRVYKSRKGKYEALVREIKQKQEKGQPVLVGTISIEQNEEFSEILQRDGVKHEILNAKNHEREAEIIAQAGAKGSVTLATNMAGRGVDIVLGGAPFDKQRAKEVKSLGGLHVLGTERHEARRIDNQLRGRGGRQGDPGSSRFFISVDDDLMRIFGSDRIKNMMNRLGVPEDMPIENKMVSRAIESAQKKVEGNNFDIRKHVVQYDDVMNHHRESIYRQRRTALSASKEGELRNQLFEMIEHEIAQVVNLHTASSNCEDWNLEEIEQTMTTIFPSDVSFNLKEAVCPEGYKDKGKDAQMRTKLIDYLVEKAKEIYSKMSKSLGNEEQIIALERAVLLNSIDTLWMDHLESLDNLRTAVGLRGYGQRDPLVEYKRDAYGLFQQLQGSIQNQVVYSVFKIMAARSMQAKGAGQAEGLLRALGTGLSGLSGMRFSAPAKEGQEKGESPIQQSSSNATQMMQNAAMSSSAIASVPRNRFGGEKVGRNDPCPCGSGKKFKKCHGK